MPRSQMLAVLLKIHTAPLECAVTIFLLVRQGASGDLHLPCHIESGHALKLVKKIFF